MPPKTMPMSLRQIHDGFAEQRAQMAPDGLGGQVQAWVREVTALDWVQEASLRHPARADSGHCREVFMVFFKDIRDTNLKQPRCDLLMVCHDDEGKRMFTRMHPSRKSWGRLAFTGNLKNWGIDVADPNYALLTPFFLDSTQEEAKQFGDVDRTRLGSYCEVHQIDIITKREIEACLAAARQAGLPRNLTDRKDEFNWIKFLRGTKFGRAWDVHEFWVVEQIWPSTIVFYVRLSDHSEWTINPVKRTAARAVNSNLERWLSIAA